MTIPSRLSRAEGGREGAARGEEASVYLCDPLVLAFEAGTIDPPAFRHREHLYVAWCYLKALPAEDALARYVRHLRVLTAKLGVPSKFHATLTWAYVALLDGAMRDPALVAADFETLLRRYPSLLDAKHGMIFDYYDAAELGSDVARSRFVLPLRK